MQVRFWGVRGSVASPGRDTVVYGGNTACLELRLNGSDRVIIIDAGSGNRGHGAHLIRSRSGPIEAEIFLTHTHWDHIMGFPFFDPIYRPNTRLKVYGPITYEDDTLDRIVGDQLSYRYFPVRHSELSAAISYHQLREGEMRFSDGLRIKTKYLNHSLLCLGYRFEFDGKVLCTGYDTEPFQNVFSDDPDSPGYDPVVCEEGAQAVADANAALLGFFDGADLLIHDAQYTLSEYSGGKSGWGHSPMEHAIATAQAAGVKKVVLFHHDPDRRDDELQALEDRFRAVRQPPGAPEILVAREGMLLKV
jgi:phosphoribosyl 1,2-cyclic phosphodiesterase